VLAIMSSADFWDSLCEEHGGLSHAVMHEAGHAVVAVLLDFVFEDVSVYVDPWAHQVEIGRVRGGGVRFSSPDELERIVQADRKGSAPFFFAGVLAERTGFGHALDRSFEVDLNLWRTYADLVGGQTPESIESAVGESVGALIATTNEILRDRSSELLGVCHALGEHDEMVLTFEEVRSIVAAS
jgi:hypothetical protein